jgi:hypothetical protein
MGVAGRVAFAHGRGGNLLGDRRGIGPAARADPVRRLGLTRARGLAIGKVAHGIGTARRFRLTRRG